MFLIYVLNLLTLYFWLLLVCLSDYHSTGESANAKSRRCIPERQTEVLTGVNNGVNSLFIGRRRGLPGGGATASPTTASNEPLSLYRGCH